MIQPHEEVPGEYGHPRWKLNMFIGLALCVVGIALIGSVVGIVYGAIVLAIGAAWAVGACIVGTMQERADAKRGVQGDGVHDTMRPTM